ncbi:hypothetical protein D3C86_2134220 [compost metagenome]
MSIKPHLGAIGEISGEMPHPAGTIAASYKINGTSLQAEITLPANVWGEFVWEGKKLVLKPGKNSLRF